MDKLPINQKSLEFDSWLGVFKLNLFSYSSCDISILAFGFLLEIAL